MIVASIHGGVMNGMKGAQRISLALDQLTRLLGGVLSSCLGFRLPPGAQENDEVILKVDDQRP